MRVARIPGRCRKRPQSQPPLKRAIRIQSLRATRVRERRLAPLFCFCAPCVAPDALARATAAAPLSGPTRAKTGEAGVATRMPRVLRLAIGALCASFGWASIGSALAQGNPAYVRLAPAAGALYRPDS